MDRYLTHGTAPTKKLQTFFLVRHLFDAHLFPAMDIDNVITLLELIQQRNAGSAELPEHRRTITRELKAWVDQHFLLRYCDVSKPEYFLNQISIPSSPVSHWSYRVHKRFIPLN
nr:DUF6138 family protein [Pectobacterium sp. PL152]